MVRRDVNFRILGDPKDLKRAVADAQRAFGSLESTAKKTSRGIDVLKKGAVALAGAFAVKKIANFVGETVGLAVAAEEAGSAFRTTFGPATQDVAAFVDEFANKAGLARFELEQMLAISGAVVQGLGATEEESAELAETMATLAGDIASFSNVSGGAAPVLAAFQSALTGEREALKTYGIVISEADVQQRALLDTNKEAATELTKLEKATATMALAAERAGKQVGDLDRTQESTSNTMRRLGAQFKEAKVSIGQALLPALEKLLPVIEELIPAFAEFTEGIADSTAELVAGAAPLLKWLALIPKVTDATKLAAVPTFSLGGAIGFLGRRIVDSNPVILGFRIAQGLMGDAVEETTEAIAAQIDELTGADKALVGIAKPLEELPEPIKEVNKELEKSVKEFEAWQKGVNAAAARAETDLRESMGSIIDLFDAAPEQIKTSVDEMLANIRAQRELAVEFEANMRVLAAAGLTALVDELEKAGPAAARLTGDLANDANAAFEAEFDLRTILGEEVDSLIAGKAALESQMFGFGMTLQQALARGFSASALQVVTSQSSASTTTSGPRPFEFAHGGTVPGPRGKAQLAVVHGGETVTPAAQSAGNGRGGVTIIVNGFVGSETQLAAVIDRVLTRRSRTSGLSF